LAHVNRIDYVLITHYHRCGWRHTAR
jgi:hypothetical protein